MACADKAHQVDSEAGHPPRLLCIYLSIYLYLGASFVGRPICVCAVLAPLRRVNKYLSIWATQKKLWIRTRKAPHLLLVGERNRC